MSTWDLQVNAVESKEVKEERNFYNFLKRAFCLKINLQVTLVRVDIGQRLVAAEFSDVS